MIPEALPIPMLMTEVEEQQFLLSQNTKMREDLGLGVPPMDLLAEDLSGMVTCRLL